MRTDLVLNYEILEYTSDQITAYYNAMDAMGQALEGLKEVLKNQESDAVATLSDKIKTASTNMDHKMETLRQLRSILDRYIDGMENLVGAANRNEKVRADQYDIWYNINQIESPVNKLERGVASAAWGSSSWIPVKEEDYMRNIREKEERNYTKLESMRSGKLVGLASNLKKYVADIWDIYNDYIKPFENLDDDYRKELNAIYKARTSDEDKRSNFWDSFKSIGLSFLKAFAIAFVGAFLVALLPGSVIVGALVVLAVGCVIMANVPEESVPNWMKGAKQTADAVADKAVQVLEEGPMVLVEDIGQGFMDQIQTPEGIAAVAGEFIGGFAGGFAGTKVKAKIKAKGVDVKPKSEFDDFDPSQATNKQKGNYGEYKANDNLVNNKSLKDAGYDLESIGREVPTSPDDPIVKGIDGLYKNNNPNSDIKYVVDEAKFGSSNLGRTKDGLQMSDDWLTGAKTGNNRILDAVNGDKKLAEKIMDALDNGQVERVLTKVDSQGVTTTFKLDASGKIIGNWP